LQAISKINELIAECCDGANCRGFLCNYAHRSSAVVMATSKGVSLPFVQTVSNATSPSASRAASEAWSWSARAMDVRGVPI
jgi:hypothetical protein